MLKHTQIKAMALGLTAAAIFSATFIVNRGMALGGGNWISIAFMRFALQTVLLAILIYAYDRAYCIAILKRFRAKALYWVTAGTLNYAVMFAAIAYSSGFLSSWLVATTLQLATVATPIVLYFFGLPPRKRTIVFALIVVLGVYITNQQFAAGLPLRYANVYAVAALVFAAFAFPIGNQLAYRQSSGMQATENRLLRGFDNTFLMSLGALPVLAVGLCIVHPALPSSNSIMGTAIITVLSGLIATPLFQYARALCKTGHELSAVDSTLASECVVTLLLESVCIGIQPLTPGTWFGMALVCIGIASYQFYQPRRN